MKITFPRALVATVSLAAAILANSCAGSPETKGTQMKTQKPILVMAHRGFRSIAPENTLPAAQKGYDIGADFWELDVAASSDGVLFVMHDDSLARTTNCKEVFPSREPWTVYDFTYEEIRKLDAGSWYAATDPFKQIALGKLDSKTAKAFAGTKVPSLEEALELTKRNNWKVNIEIKDATGRASDPWIVEKTAQLVRSMGMSGSVVVSSFNHEYLKRMKKAAPEIAVAALIDRPVADPVALLAGLGAIALNPNWKYLDEATVRKVREAGYDVYAWTVNETWDMEKLLSWGVTGLISDFPDKALQVLGRKN
jgi:glycerophosphoryl diester phosphodiesterase